MATISATQFRKPFILVIGNSGTVGSETIKYLKKLNANDTYSIRWGVRNLDKARNLLQAGDLANIELVHLELNKQETLDSAFVGVCKVFLVLGLHSDRHKYVKRVVDACKRVNVEHLLFLSVVGCSNKSSTFLKTFREAEEIIEASGIVYTFLRTVFFQENFLFYSQMIQQGQLRLPIGMGRFSPLSTCDVAEISAKILVDNTRNHAYRTYDLTGGELFDGNSLCNLFTRCLGKEIIFSPTSFNDSLQFLQNLGFPSWVCQGFIDLYEVIANNQAAVISQDGELLLGRKMTNVDSLINKNKDKFLFSGQATQQQQFGGQQAPQQVQRQFQQATYQQPVYQQAYQQQTFQQGQAVGQKQTDWEFQQQQRCQEQKIWPK